MNRLRVPFVIHWAGTPKPDLSGFIEPVRVPFRFVRRQLTVSEPKGPISRTVEFSDPNALSSMFDLPATSEQGRASRSERLLAGSFTSDVGSVSARALGMSRNDFSDALHSLKKAAGLGGADNVLIHLPSGDVFYNGENIGNLHDE
jgi:hypothetical protein